MRKLLTKTRILCTDHAKHPKHEVRIYTDGHVECECGESAVEEARRIGTAVTLGNVNASRRSCAGFIAFLTVGLPRLIADHSSDRGEWGGWQPAWTAYGSNAALIDVYRDLAARRDAVHAAALKIAFQALKRCGRYRDGMTAMDFADGVVFIPDSLVTTGSLVALFASDRWEIPLQRDWLESVGKAQPVIDGRFVVGVSEHPGFVYAIDGDQSAGFHVREFAVIGNKLGKVAVTR